jgi:hypothetical protein
MSATVSLWLVVAFIAGFLLLLAGMLFWRRSSEPEIVQWTQALGFPPDTPLDIATRRDIVERLAILDEPWAREALQSAAQEERNPTIQRIIKKSLNA